MKLINYPPHKKIEIEFKLNIDNTQFKMGEDFCMLMDIIVNLNNKKHHYENIKIDKTSVKGFINHLNTYIEKEIDEIDYSPLEECFWIFEKKSKLSEEDIINEINKMEELGCSEETIEQLKNEAYAIKLVLQIDKEYSEKHGHSSRIGEAYIINVTKENLKNFVEEFQSEFEKLTVDNIHDIRRCTDYYRFFIGEVLKGILP